MNVFGFELILLVATLFRTALCGPKLLFVHALWRHGARTPVRIIPTDTVHNLDYWKLGLGQLTKVGLQQSYQLGQLFRQKYIRNTDPAYNLLDQYHSNYDIYIRSTDYNRTLLSAQALLFGMYPGGGDPMLPADWPGRGIDVQPIPIHTVPQTTDSLLKSNAPCTATERLLDDILQTDKSYAQLNKKHKKLLKFIEQKTGFMKMDIGMMWMVFDPLMVVKFMNGTLPEWVNETVWEQIKTIHAESTRYMYPTVEIQRLRAGRLLTDMTNRMVAIADNISNLVDHRLKFVGYSGHDLITTAVLEAFKAYPGEFGTFSSCITVELWKEDGKLVVKTYYKPNATVGLEAIPIVPSGCPSHSCPLDQFKARNQPYFITDQEWKEECFSGPTNDNSTKEQLIKDYKATARNAKTLAIVAFLVAVGVAVAFLVLLLFFLKLRREKSANSFELQKSNSFERS